MKISPNFSKSTLGLLPIIFSTFLAGCGGGSLDPILGSDGTAANTTKSTPTSSTTNNPATPNTPVVSPPINTPANPPNLGTAEAFGVFGGSAGVTNQGVNTIVNGNLGTTAACSLNTGFHDALNVFDQTPLNVGGVNGTVYCGPPAPGTVASMDIATQARADILAAFNTLSAMPAGSDPGAGQLGGLVLAPAVYTAAGGTFNLTSGNLTLDGQGNSNAVWVFQSAAALTVGLSATPRSVTLINGAQAKNVFWKVGSAARIEDGSSMVGTIIAPAGVTISTAGQATQTTLVGRALSLTASVTMVNTTIVAP